MDNFSEKIKELAEPEFPHHLHGRIMADVYLKQFKVYFASIISLLTVNLAFSAWHLWTRMVELDSFSILRATLDSFDWSFDFITNLYQSFTDFVPISAIAIFVFNLGLAVYSAYLFWKLKYRIYKKVVEADY